MYEINKVNENQCALIQMYIYVHVYICTLESERVVYPSNYLKNTTIIMARFREASIMIS